MSAHTTATRADTRVTTSNPPQEGVLQSARSTEIWPTGAGEVDGPRRRDALANSNANALNKSDSHSRRCPRSLLHSEHPQAHLPMRLSLRLCTGKQRRSPCTPVSARHPLLPKSLAQVCLQPLQAHEAGLTMTTSAAHRAEPRSVRARHW